MTLFLVLLLLGLVWAQPLSMEQHSALMTVYDQLGEAAVFRCRFVRSIHMWSSRAACDNRNVYCPRFANGEKCVGIGVICSQGNVVEL
jgi:hypothetical protein